MSFTHRLINLDDVDWCISITREGFAYSPAQRAPLASLWKELIGSKSCNSVAIEDRKLPPGKRVVGFGLSVFVTDAFAQRVLGGLPLVSRAFLEQWQKGERPFLTPPETAQANAGEGLNLMVLHYGWNPKLSPEDLQRSQLLQTERFIHTHAGYKTKEYLHEVFGSQLRDFVLSAGSVLRRDYKEKKWKPFLAGVSPDNWPYLTGFRPEEALAKSGTPVSMFQAKSVPPRFHFAPSEQAVLAQALSGKTDEELAAALNLSHWTVKKRWQALYLKVKKSDPELLDDIAEAKEGEERRNRQRRRYLLDYLRHHPEELRPLSPKKK